MRVQSELETRLHADALELDRAFPKTQSLERRILARVAITAREQRRSLTRLQEMALAGLVVVAVTLLAVGISQLRALTKPAPARTPPALSTSTSPSACPPTRGVWMNATTGWQGDPDRTDWYGLPLRTTDGGLHWQRVQVQPLNGPPLKTGSTSCFLDADHAWVTLQTLGALVIYRTTDGGRTWQSGDPVPGGVGRLIARLAFLDAKLGWLLTDAQGMPVPGCAGAGVPNPTIRTIYSTTDGGLHWKQIVRACSGDGSTLGTLATGCSETGLTFVDVSTGWLTWDCGPPSWPLVPVLDTTGLPLPAGPIVASTRDGGRSWQRVALPSYPSSGQSACGAWPPVFTLGHGVLPITCQGTGHSAVFRTDDGGRSWSLLRPPSESDLTVDYFIDASSGWAFSHAVGSNAVAPNGNDLYRTTDGGRDWVLVKRGLFSGRAVVSVQFLDDSVGFVFTMSPTIGVGELKTADGGQTWAVVQTTPGG